MSRHHPNVQRNDKQLARRYPLFDTEGRRLGAEPNYRQYKQLQFQLIAIRKSLEKKVPWACRYAHEKRLARLSLQNRSDEYPSEGGALACLCPEEVRLQSPQCAHVMPEEQNYIPDPYGKEIRELINYGALDGISWTHWHSRMQTHIENRDLAVSLERLEFDDTKKKLPLTIIGQEQDADNVELIRKQRVMIGAIDQILMCVSSQTTASSLATKIREVLKTRVFSALAERLF